MSALSNSTVWKALEKDAQNMQGTPLKTVSDDTTRQQKYGISAAGIRLDYTRHLLDDDILKHLINLAEQQKVAQWRDKMFSGARINHTEDRAVLHTALRAPEFDEIMVDGADIMPDILGTRQRMFMFARDVRDGIWTGGTGMPISDVVNIGIGGSDLGPKMVVEALKPFHNSHLRFHFVSNVDATHLTETLGDLRPENTLFIIASKTFTTTETLTNAKTARDWIKTHIGDHAIANHFVALSSAPDRAVEFGINRGQVFGFADWVGGRYSVWSAIGMTVAMAIGAAGFTDFLMGARTMDDHFKTAPLSKNMPVIMALLGIWYRNFMKYPAHAVLPYDQYLESFPRYLQQLDMESNGKHTDRDGNRVDYDTGPIIFGEVGTNGQHAFYQLIHQGTTVIPCDFIVTKKSQHDVGNHHKILNANAYAQPDALAIGRDLKSAGNDPYRVFDGNRPSNILELDELNPKTLGALIALYEHKVFTQGMIWNINSFDQFGVELGKEMAKKMME